MSAFVKKSKVPETVVGEEGTAKRNILRKKGPGQGRHGRKEGIPGHVIDDGSNYTDSYALDERDPNYDSEELVGNEFIPTTSYTVLHRDDIAKSNITLTKYKKLIQPIMVEFFSSADIIELATRLEEISAPEYTYEFVKRIINKSCDKGDKERELVSQLLSALYPDTMSSNMIGKGFERLFEIIDEIEIDCPNAKNIVAIYLARAVKDEVLPPSFLSDAVVCNLGGDIVDMAKLMLSREHCGARLDHSWGPGDGRPVEEMKVVVDQLLEEYLTSADLEEAVHCTVELQSPHFYHEVVKRAVRHAIDKSIDQQQLMSTLLSRLAQDGLLSIQQAEKGFDRLHGLLPDMSLDTPYASEVLRGFTVRAIEDGVLSAAYQPTTSIKME